MAEVDNQTVAGPAESAPRQPAPGEAQAEQLTGMISLVGQVASALVRPPFSWWREFVDQAWVLILRATPPAAFSAIFIGLALAVQAGTFLDLVGAADRIGSGYVLGSVREFAPFVTGVVVAGVGGTAICADLGARRIREELDALSAIGVDITRQLVLPRVLALAVITSAMNFVTMAFGAVGAAGGGAALFSIPLSSFLGTFTASFAVPDLLGSAVKAAIYGLAIGVVCAYKGLHAKGGAEGVGRAVNQAVVICFLTIFVINYVFNSVLLAAFPETTSIR